MIDRLKKEGFKEFYDKIFYEEHHYVPYEMKVHVYYILPREVFDKSFLEDSECVDSGCLRMKLNYIEGIDTKHPFVEIAPTSDGIDFNWTDISLNEEDKEFFIDLLKKQGKPKWRV